jgi:glucosamine 6-phosphate synthetase-like amidotransferase/phosphosugar isomerase protein
MCGITGRISTTPFPASIMYDMQEKLKTRGQTSIGFVYTVGKDVMVVKSMGFPSKQVMKLDDETTIAIGHNRMPSRGEATPSNIHPFGHKGIYFGHNGSLDTGLLAKLIELKKVDVTLEGNTDSEVVIKSLLELSDSDFYVLSQLLPSVSGSYAITMINTNTNELWAFKGSGSAMVISVSENTVAVASESEAVPDGELYIAPEKGFALRAWIKDNHVELDFVGDAELRARKEIARVTYATESVFGRYHGYTDSTAGATTNSNVYYRRWNY